MKHTVIFDIDGVIVDSEQLHFDVLKELAPEQTQGVVPEDLIGLSLEETLTQIGVPVEKRSELTDSIVDVYKKSLAPEYLRPGSKALIEALIAQQVPFGFVSTAPRDICLANIATLELDLDPILISGDDVERTKPYPDPYLAMLERLGADGETTIVIEDTDLGIKAATTAGIHNVFGWPHALSGTESYELATRVIKDLSEIPHFDALSIAA
ncbi:HAD family hydrolase [Dongshaea marina]|uniref:HAD family hydrolase n=1 Tax=Dongshaea marina TaxID=2047966 RepID=UPI001F45B2A8|nr:HAD family phosphatase [Dongshaea marina]